MSLPSISPRDDDPAAVPANVQRQLVKLRRINEVLMQRVERSMEQQANAYSLFQTAIGLETQVRVRTEELKSALIRLERINDELTTARDNSDRANRIKTRFFTAVGHDLLQPLHAARLSLSALTETGSDFAEQTAVKQIDHALGSIEEILRTILDISRLEAGVIKPDLRPVAVQEMLESLVGSLEPLARTKNLVLTSRPTEAAVISDPVMLRRIMQNLLANAVHYTQTGAIKIAARRRGDQIRIEVWDTGPGISEAEQKWIFEEFQRGTASETAKRGGFGLGLSIAQRMAETLGHPSSACDLLTAEARIDVLGVGSLCRQCASGSAAAACHKCGNGVWVCRRPGADHRQRCDGAGVDALAAGALVVPDAVRRRIARIGRCYLGSAVPARYHSCRLSSRFRRMRFGWRPAHAGGVWRVIAGDRGDGRPFGRHRR